MVIVPWDILDAVSALFFFRILGVSLMIGLNCFTSAGYILSPIDGSVFDVILEGIVRGEEAAASPFLRILPALRVTPCLGLKAYRSLEPP